MIRPLSFFLWAFVIITYLIATGNNSGYRWVAFLGCGAVLILASYLIIMDSFGKHEKGNPFFFFLAGLAVGINAMIVLFYYFPLEILKQYL